MAVENSDMATKTKTKKTSKPSSAKRGWSSEEIARRQANIDLAKELKKPRLVSVLFCDFANQTVEGKLNLLGIFDRIFVDPELKKTPPVGFFVRTGGTFDGPVEITILDPNDQMVAVLSFAADDMSKTEGKHFQMQVVGKVQFPTSTEGLYWFDISYQGESLGGTGLQIEYRKLEADNNEHTRSDA